LRSNTKGYGSKNSDTTAPSGRELYHLQFSMQVASPENYGYTFVHVHSDRYIIIIIIIIIIIG
jgi:hypothetical protein